RMSEQPAGEENKVGKCLLSNRVEERASAGLDAEETKIHIQRHGHKGILSMDQESKMETMTTLKAAYAAPKSPGVRLRGTCLCLPPAKKLHAERNPPIPKTEYCSTTQTDFCVKGFVSSTPETTQVHDYKTDQAISFWSENYQRVQGVTAAQTSQAPFRKSAKFSTPISERMLLPLERLL
uniref:Sperm associated antigen 8 n=1 Tax=Amphiprion percula TaxID=161767 RepID=A0A3P8TJM3_AMPPE